MTLPTPSDRPSGAGRATEQEKLATLFDLGRRVTSVLDLDELLVTIPDLIARIISFDAFAIYLLDERRRELRIAYSVGYPDEAAERVRLKVGEGLVGLSIVERAPLVANDLSREPRYVEVVPDMRAQVVAPLIYKGRPIGALSILSRSADVFGESDALMVRQFGVHVAVALENARLFDKERTVAEVFETLASIGRDLASILDLDELLMRVAQFTRRLVDYRTFGIMLLNEEAGELEMRLALQYGERVDLPRVGLGDGLVGYAALHKQPVYVPDVAQDPRYIRVVADVRSELVIPLIYKDRAIGVFDLESPELDAFDKWHVEVLTLLASHAAVAIENARLYEELRANEERLDREVRFAQRVQMALLPAGSPKRLRGVDVAGRFAPASELGGDLYDLLSPDAHTLIVAVGDVSGKGVPAALYGTFAGELVRSRTYRRRYTTERTSPPAVLASINTILHERDLEGYYCTLCYAVFDLKRKVLTMSNSGLPYPVRVRGSDAAQIVIPGVPLGSFAGSTYDELTFDLAPGDVFVFASDGLFDAMRDDGEEFGAGRVIEVVRAHAGETAQQIVDALFGAVDAFRDDAPQGDDMTAVALRVTA
ncbi:MAG: GAF domain-containing protein [Acidobacteria bacterium]|nr:GAF domain-containing protein [Acidobacteriota bacterium]